MSTNPTIQSIYSKVNKNYNSIDSLPDEVVQEILEYTNLETYSPRTQDGTRYPINNDYPTLKTMRLVNAAFNKVASRHLFRIIVLYEHPERYAALNKVAGTPYLACWVRRIQLANLGYLPDCQDFEEYVELIRRSRGPSSTHFRHPPAGGPLAKLDFSMERCFERYTDWRDGERIMKEHVKNGTAPPLDLHLLPSLSRVESIGLFELRVVKRKPAETLCGELSTQQPETRRFYETGLIEENAMKNSRYVRLCHLPTFMIAASTSGKDIRCFTVHRLDELLKSEHYNDDNDAIHLPNLRRLEIDLREIWYSYGGMDDPGNLASWLHNLTELEELHIYQNPHMAACSADVVRLLRHLSLPTLSTVDFRNVNASFTSLKRFLSKHNKTLKSIKIVEPTMKQERWDDFHQRFAAGGSRAAGKKIWFSKEVWRSSKDGNWLQPW
ncbi:hypothetical protein G7Y79_00076g099260 [Physcia stellaris]|nr:hypothetical protein G7Y79_00076g099260 [Physcia stellaris]